MKFHKLPLDEILALNYFDKYYQILENYSPLQTVVDWAEAQVMQGETSGHLLILASLGLDTTLSKDDVELYLNRFLIEKGIEQPDIAYSSLIFLRIWFQQIINSNSFDDMSYIISSVTHRWYDLPCRVFHKIEQYWNGVYYQYFDLYTDLYSMSGDEQYSEQKRFQQIKSLAERFYRLLNNKDMLIVLT